MKFLTTCLCCRTTMVIEENIFFYEPATKGLETAYCPECGQKIFEKEFYGWFYVQRNEILLKQSEIKLCAYPMP